ncbi:sulfotransferase [Emticicia sp. 21SJ11W-3]|uniref:sulfotransferase family protein n=1 Tax=Emticicia sp. 21SJ11W-3 TaxID=2916755 RepID=UPI00209D83BA|nr:sulfotransferase [Emticicia sp. 21SJ11W-3]UTA68757.1 sulfotransferase domain-containing protein [Emticicia sp. 21SJ11W-3]
MKSEYNLNKRIDFIGIGVQKAGTTALYYYLNKHPDILMSKYKELHYFSNLNIDFEEESRINYSNYHQNFDWTTPGIRGEITPRYCYLERCIPLIHQYNPAIKIIMILRNPVERAYSHWNMRLQKKEIGNSTFANCLKAEILRMNFDIKFNQMPEDDYIRRGFYSKQIRHIFDYFPSQQVLILKYEDFRDNQYQHLLRIFDFLGVNGDNYKFEEKKVHHIHYKEEIDGFSLNLLNDIYKEEIEKVEKLLNWNCTDWKNDKI